MRITAYNSTALTMPHRTLPNASEQGEWQIDVGGGFYAYVTADDAEALAAGWAELATELRRLDAESSETEAA